MPIPISARGNTKTNHTVNSTELGTREKKKLKLHFIQMTVKTKSPTRARSGHKAGLGGKIKGK